MSLRRCLLRVRVACALLAGLALVAPARAASTWGTDFWACDLENIAPATDEPFALIVANPQIVDVGVRVETTDGIVTAVVVPPRDFHAFTFDRTRMMRGTQLAPNAYHVMASEPVTVLQVNPLGAVNARSSDVSVLLPLTSLGTEHRPTCREGFHEPIDGDDLPGLLAVVGTSIEPTTLTIVPRADVSAGSALPATPAGTPLVVTLRRFDVLQLQSEIGSGDLTGSLVRSDRPVAVFGGARSSFVPSTTVAAEHLEEQIPPVSAWGLDHLLVKAAPRFGESDAWRVVAAEDHTLVTLTPPVLAPIVLDAGESVEFLSTGDVHAVSDRPVQVGQFFVGAGPDPGVGTGDPSLMLTIPTDQFPRVHSFVVPPTHDEDHVTIVAPEAASVLLDGSRIPRGQFAAIGTTGYERARLPVSDGMHHIESDLPVGAYVYGYSSYSAYATPTGASTDVLHSPLACNPGGPYFVDCGGTTLLDGSRSAGPPTLGWLWSSLSPGVTFATPDQPATFASFSGFGPWIVALTLSNATTSTACYVTVEGGSGDRTPPRVDCADVVTVAPTQPGSAYVPVHATAVDGCDPSVTIVNDRTTGAGDASDTYPCGETWVAFSSTDSAGNAGGCVTTVVVLEPEPPVELAAATDRWLRVAKDPSVPGILRITYGRTGAPTELDNLYTGTIPTSGMVAYDHVPLLCHVMPASAPRGMAQLVAPLDAGAIRYYLVSASNCLAEGTRGFASDGTERPAIFTDCGPL